MELVRTHANCLEAKVADDLWSLPIYQEIFFLDKWYQDDISKALT
jgi:glutamine synthetase type III